MAKVAPAAPPSTFIIGGDEDDAIVTELAGAASDLRAFLLRVHHAHKDSSSALCPGGGLYKLNPVVTHSLKPPGFNH